MRFLKTARALFGVALAVLLAAAPASAQTTSGTITGRVIDNQSLAVPGVTVTVEGANLQGALSAVTSENGDYIVPQLPPGTYTVTFTLSGFGRQQRTIAVAPTQTVPLNVTLGVAALDETVNVVGKSADVLTQTAQVATNFQQELIATLPTNRDITSTLLMAPAVHPSGPAGNFSIAGAMSYESLYLVNGVTVNENLRGQAFNIYIEDAIQETTVASDGVSAEYGRFSGGLVNVITKSGSNLFSGSFRESLFNDDWRALVTGNGNYATPAAGATTQTCNTVVSLNGAQGVDPGCFANDTKVDKVVPTHEYVLGGPIRKDQLWFFTAGRFQNQQTGRNTIQPVNLAYVSEDQRKRFEVKMTGSLNSNHRLEGAYSKEALTQVNNTFSTASSMDTASLYTRETPLDLYTLNYNGILSSKFFVEARVSSRHFSFIGSGSPFTDLIKGTLLIDRARGGRYWSPTFCGVCDPEKRDNDNENIKATYFKSTSGSGSHQMVFGYDTFNDKRFANNHQSGSDYRIVGTTSIIRGTGADAVIYPQWLPGASTILQYNPIATSTLGTAFRTHSLFFNDQWRMNPRLTLNLGVRYDKNHGADSAGNLVADDSAFSPRVGVVWDLRGNGEWAVSASVSKYVAAINNGIADSSSAAGNPATLQWTYSGPAINPDASAATLVGSAAAIQQVFNWCAPDARGNCTVSAPSGTSLPGVSVKIPNGLASPNVLAYAVGISRQFGNKATVRADYSFRDYKDLYSQRVDRSTGTIVDSFGNVADLAIVENTNDLKRRYSGATISANYRFSARTNIGGNYTLSRLWGNFDGENVASGPLTSNDFQYPEYRQASWYTPAGDLSADQRHRSTLWLQYGVPKIDGLILSLLEDLASGVPYGAVGTVDARPFVAASNPAVAAAYATPQGGASETYYFTARDAFRTEASRRTDFAANYSHGVGSGSRKATLFVQAQLLNVFNQQELCGCGGTIFQNGGNGQLNTIQGGTAGESVLTSLNTATLQTFNPLTTAPVQGTNWNYNANFGTPKNRFAFTSPRAFRLSFGVRF
jgi:outer membrane receptor protein involved in Fe transport